MEVEKVVKRVGKKVEKKEGKKMKKPKKKQIAKSVDVGGFGREVGKEVGTSSQTSGNEKKKQIAKSAEVGGFGKEGGKEVEKTENDKKPAKSNDSQGDGKSDQAIRKSPVESLFSRVAREYVNHEYALKIRNTIDEEKKTDLIRQHGVWAVLCESYKRTTLTTGIYHKALTANDIMSIPAEELYMESLTQRLGQVFMANVKTFHEGQLFKQFLDNNPLVMYVSQKRLKEDILPRCVDVYMSYANAVENNLIPSNLHSVNLVEDERETYKGTRAVCYGIFHSFTHGKNLIAAYYVCPSEKELGKYACKWLEFDRFVERKNNVISI
jgi:hypothetical protein